MDTLGDDLLLLLIRPKDGKVAKAERIDFGLMGSELIRLAAAGRVDISEGRVVVSQTRPTGDSQLDVALRSLAGGGRPVKLDQWVAKPRRRIRAAYFDRLRASGAIRPVTRRVALIIPAVRWEIIDEARVAGIRDRLDRIAQGNGWVAPEQAAFGGLAYAVGLDRHLYPGWPGRAQRKRLAEVADGQWTIRVASAGARPPGTDGGAAGAEADSTNAAMQAATHAATHAAVHAATHAAVHAAHQAGHSAASSGHAGGGGGHH